MRLWTLTCTDSAVAGKIKPSGEEGDVDGNSSLVSRLI